MAKKKTVAAEVPQTEAVENAMVAVEEAEVAARERAVAMAAEVDAALEETERAVREHVGAALFGERPADKEAEEPATRDLDAFGDHDRPTLDLTPTSTVAADPPEEYPSQARRARQALARLRELEAGCASGADVVQLADIRQLIAMLDPPA